MLLLDVIVVHDKTPPVIDPVPADNDVPVIAPAVVIDAVVDGVAFCIVNPLDCTDPVVDIKPEVPDNDVPVIAPPFIAPDVDIIPVPALKLVPVIAPAVVIDAVVVGVAF